MGTLITDTLTDVYSMPLPVSTGDPPWLATTSSNWYSSKGTLSVGTIITSKHESSLASLSSSRLAWRRRGNYLSEDVGLRYLRTALLFRTLILATWLAYHFTSLGRVTAYRAAYVMTSHSAPRSATT